MPDNRESREERSRERSSLMTQNPREFFALQESERIQNMAKLLMVSREKKTHLGDVLNPNQDVKKRLDEMAADLAVIQLGSMYGDEKIQEKYDKEWEDCAKECRDFVIDMDYEKESIYALGINPKGMKRSERNAILNDPQNMDALKKITDDMSNCIKNADEFHDLSSVMVGKEASVPVPLVKERIESLDNVSRAIDTVKNQKLESKENKQEERQAEKTDPGAEITSKDLEYLKTDETYTNMAKLLVMSRDNLHFGDVQNPSPEIQERLDKTVDSLVAIQARTLSLDEKVRKAGEKAWEKCTEVCRGFVMDMNYNDECLRALGMDPEKTDPARREAVMNDPQNMGALKKITDGMADCIEKADKYGMLSNIRIDGKDEPIPNIKKQVESLREFSSVYGAVAPQEKKEKSSSLNGNENKVKSAAKQAPSKADGKMDKLNAARAQMAKSGARPRVAAESPQITGAQDLQTKMSILQWIAYLLGLSDNNMQKSIPSPEAQNQNPENQKKMPQPENKKKEQEKENRQKVASEKKASQNSLKAKAAEGKNVQAKNVQQKADGGNAQKKSDLNARYLATIQDARREILRLRIENMRKTNMIRLLSKQMTPEQIRKAALEGEKLIRNEKAVKKDKPAVEKISFKQLSKEEADSQPKKQNRERRSMERKSMERNSLQMSEKTKKSRERSFGK